MNHSEEKNPKPIHSSFIFLNPHQALTLIANNRGGSTCKNPGSTWQESTIISGEWYNTLVIGHKLFGQEQTVENSTYKIEYTNGNPKNCFLEMKTFTDSFKKAIKCVTK